MSELSPAARALLDLAGQSERSAPVKARARMRRAIVAATVLPATAAASVSLLKLVAVGVVSAALGSGLTLAVTHRAPAATQTPAVVAPKSIAAPVAPPVPPPPEPELSAPSPVPVAVSPSPERRALPSSPTPAREETPVSPPPEPEETPVAPVTADVPHPSDESLAAELESLNTILSAIEARRFDEASTALEGFRARFRSPSLDVEARVLEVRVRCGQGNTEEARDLAGRLRIAFPRNPSVQRLDPTRICLER